MDDSFRTFKVVHCPWLPLVAPSNLIICTLTIEKITFLTHTMGKLLMLRYIHLYLHTWVQVRQLGGKHNGDLVYLTILILN